MPIQYTQSMPDDDDVVTKGFLRETLKKEFAEFGSSIAETLLQFQQEMREFREEMRVFQKETQSELKALRTETEINKRALGSLLN
jgi:hypothetical protein